jgi:hypothetical protein
LGYIYNDDKIDTSGVKSKENVKYPADSSDFENDPLTGMFKTGHMSPG